MYHARAHTHTELLPFFLFFSASSLSLKKFSTVNGEAFSLIERPTPAAARSTEGGFISTRVNARLEERRRREREREEGAGWLYHTHTLYSRRPPPSFIKRHARLFSRNSLRSNLFCLRPNGTNAFSGDSQFSRRESEGLGNSLAPLGVNC